MKRILPRFLALAACLLLLSACGLGAGVRPTAGGGDTLPAPDVRGSGAGVSPDYQIGAEDVLDVSVFGVPDLSRTVRVTADGDISLPLIGRLHAAGDTTRQLADEIDKELSRTYLQNPQVSVFVKDFASQRVTIEGSVDKPGIYPLTGQTTLMQAVALAGGLTRLAEDDGVVVFRQVQGKQMAAVFNFDKISKGDAKDPRVYAGDIIMVQQSGAKNALENFIKAAPAIGLFLLY